MSSWLGRVLQDSSATSARDDDCERMCCEQSGPVSVSDNGGRAGPSVLGGRDASHHSRRDVAALRWH